jgi:nucleoside-diphosphate-sugar epimerase
LFELKFGIFNIGTGVPSSVEDLIKTLGQVIGRELKVVSAEQERFGEINSTQASILQATNILGWKPKWTLADGLADLWKAMDQENF